MVMWPHSIRQHMPPQRILYKKRMGFGPSSFKSQNNPKFIQSHGLGFCLMFLMIMAHISQLHGMGSRPTYFSTQWIELMAIMKWAHKPCFSCITDQAHYFLIKSRFMTDIISLILNETSLPYPIKDQNYTKWVLEEKRPISRQMVYLDNKIMKP